jgi:hypothetical protein
VQAYYDNELRDVLMSSDSTDPYQAKMYNNIDTNENPFITLKDYDLSF